jgi:hypothetical protein
VSLTAVPEEAAAVIDQINALREEMQVLYEEYTKLAQFLRDKIVELGQNLSDYAKKLQEEVAENSQSIIRLETRYLLGEIGAQQYYGERQSLNESIRKNLSGLDEVKNMLGALSQIDVKPLSSSALPGPEIPFSNASPTSLQGIGEAAQVASSGVSYEAPEESAKSEGVKESSSSSIGETEKSPLPATSTENVEATDLKKEPEAQEGEQSGLEPSKTESPIVTAVQTVQTTESASPPATTVPVSEKEGEGVTPQQPSQNVVQNIKALPEMPLEPSYLPAIGDIQPEEAAVRPEKPQSKPEEPQQTYLEGSKIEVVKAVKLMPYASFYDVSCPKCGAEVPKPVKSWELKGGKSKKTVMIGLFECEGCKVKFREALSKETV